MSPKKKEECKKKITRKKKECKFWMALTGSLVSTGVDCCCEFEMEFAEIYDWLHQSRLMSHPLA